MKNRRDSQVEGINKIASQYCDLVVGGVESEEFLLALAGGRGKRGARTCSP
jgi:hypothetical protein